MNRVQWILGAAFAATLAANFIWALHSIRKPEEKREEKHEEAKRLTHDESGNSVLQIDKETQERTALKVEEIREASLPNEAVAYGRFLEDPSRTFTLRSPMAGVLRKAGEREWPRLGETLAAGAPLVGIQPRFSSVERLDLQSRLTTAQADVAATTASLEASRAAFDRTKTLNAAEKTASDRALQEAEARLKADTAKLKAATETASAIDASLGARAGAAGGLALSVERGGEVVELSAQPGETIESGQPVLRIATFDRLLAKAAVPSGDRIEGTVTRARILPLGREDRVLRGERILLAAAEPQLLGETFLFSVEAGDLRLRPGMALTAFLELPGEPKRGVLLPRSALVRQGGELWAYVQAAADKFTRREVEHAVPVDAGWFVAEGFKAGEKIVVSGAQMLLSEELKAKIEGGD
jgi:biotin carboxyl carrier protein